QPISPPFGHKAGLPPSKKYLLVRQPLLISFSQDLDAKKDALQKTYKSTEKDIQSLNRKLNNLNQYLDRIPEQEQTPNHKLSINNISSTDYCNVSLQLCL
ncbi:hypothetical protein AAAV41_04540, partial [Hominiventricola filiformis]